MTTTVEAKKARATRELKKLHMEVPYFQVSNAIFDTENDLTPIQKLVWVYLCRRGNHGDIPFPSYKRIAKDCNLGRRTAINAVQVLVEKNWLEKTTRHEPGSDYRTNEYLVNPRGGVTDAPAGVPGAPPSATDAPPGVTNAPSTQKEPFKKNPLERTYPGRTEDEEGENPSTSAAVDFFKQNFPNIEFTPVVRLELEDLVKNFSPERVIAAIKETRRHKVDSPLPYMCKVLENEGKEKSSAEKKEPGDGKFHFDNAPNAFFTHEEVLKLVEKFGKEGAGARINALSLYKASTGKVYESDYSTILSWDSRRDPDGSLWEPKSPHWEINQEWLDSLQQTPSPQPWRKGMKVDIICAQCHQPSWVYLWKSGGHFDICYKCSNQNYYAAHPELRT